jgi:DNA replication and repair protein RecF
LLDGVSLSAYGSQGQQRTAVLALKVAEYAVMRERANETPLLLLDDVLSELDEARAAAFLTEIGEYEQAFVTATHLPPGLRAGARIARVCNAEVHAWA